VKKKKPTVVIVLGILHIVFGSLSILCNLCSAGGVAIAYFAVTALYKGAPPEAQREMDTAWRGLQDQVPGLILAVCFDVIGSFLLGLILLIAGIGLLGVKVWARYLSLAWAVLRVLFLTAMLLYNIVYLQPGMERFNKDMEKAMEDMQRRQQRPGQTPPPKVNFGLGGSGDSLMNSLMSVLSTAINAVYAIVVFVLMLLPSTGHAFARYNSDEDLYGYTASEPGGEYDENYERIRRELPPD
jgi:small-conductance mechanosensitive channel